MTPSFGHLRTEPPGFVKYVPAIIVTGRLSVMGTVPLPKRCTLLGKPVGLSTLVGTLRRIAPGADPVVEDVGGAKALEQKGIPGGH